jgi:hypothetical protein
VATNRVSPPPSPPPPDPQPQPQPNPQSTITSAPITPAPIAPAPIGEAIAGALRAQQRMPGPPMPTPTPAATWDVLWERIVLAAKENRRVRVVLEDLTPISWQGGVLSLRAAPGTQLAAESVRGEIISLANAQAGMPKGEPPIDVRVEPASPLRTEGGGEASPASAAELVALHPLVQQAVMLLGARVVGVQPRKPSS